MGTGSFQGVKRPWRGIDHPHLSTAEVKERVGLYLRSPSAPSWPVLGWTLPLLDENSCESSQNASRNTWISAECQLQQRVFWEPYWVTQGPITLLSVIAICSRNVTWNTIIFFYNFYSELYFLPNVAPCKGNFQSSGRTPGFCQNVPRGKIVLSQRNQKTGYFKMSLGIQRMWRYVIRNKTIFREWHLQD